MRAATLSDTSNSGTILGVGTPGFSTGARSKSTTSTWNSRSQRELTVNQLSGKLGADQRHRSGPQPSQAKLLQHAEDVGAAVHRHRGVRPGRVAERQVLPWAGHHLGVDPRVLGAPPGLGGQLLT